MTERIGFVGLGNMGEPMARNLLNVGYDLCVYDLDDQKVARLVALGASGASRVSEVATAGSIVITMVPTDEALREVTLSLDGLLERLCPGGIHLSLSTVSPEVALLLTKCYRERGGTFIAGTVSGRPDVAARAELSIFLSGQPAAKVRVLPLVHVLGKHVYDLGEDIAKANAVKLGMNTMMMAIFLAMGETIALVEGFGVPRDLFVQAMIESPIFGGAVFEGYGPMIAEQNYRDTNFPLPMGIKDARLVLSAAKRIGLEMPLAELILKALLYAQDDGRTAESWAVMSDYAIARSDQTFE